MMLVLYACLDNFCNALERVLYPLQTCDQTKHHDNAS